jgi:hypothetical protein
MLCFVVPEFNSGFVLGNILNPITRQMRDERIFNKNIHRHSEILKDKDPTNAPTALQPNKPPIANNINRFRTLFG